MLIKCPECSKDVSDKADFCIHCGFPLKPVKEEKPVKKDEHEIQKSSEPEYKELRVDGRLFHYKTDSSKTLCPYCHTFVDKVSSSCWSCGKSLMDSSNSSNFQSNEEEKEKAFEDWRKRQSNSSTPSKEKETDGRAIGSFVTGICGLVFSFWLSGPGLICAIIGAYLGSPYTKGLGKAGKVMSWISIIVNIIALIFFCGILGAAVAKDGGLF